MLVINADEQSILIDMKEVIEQAAAALSEFSASRTITPVRSVLPFHQSENISLVMPSVAEELESVGVKIVNVVPGNRKSGRKSINGVVILFDFETGEPLALMEGSYLTMMRTGAISGVATKYLSRPDSKTATIIGTGEQAGGLLEAILAVRDIQKVILFNSSTGKANEFARNVDQKYGLDVQVAANPNQALQEADIIVTATNSHSPVFSDLIMPGVHINAVGSFRPDMQELPSHIFSAADKVIVESRQAALEESGDLQIPIREGVFHESNIYAELGEIVGGKLKGRESDQEKTVFKSVGLATVDIAVARYVYEKAVKHHAGTSIHL
jgi:ornithine cyclodeaminase